MNKRQCPFCGSTKIKAETKRTRTGEYGTGEPVYRVTASGRCGSCHARGPVVTLKRFPSSNTYGLDRTDPKYLSKRAECARKEYKALEEKAMEAWNWQRPDTALVGMFAHAMRALEAVSARVEKDLEEEGTA